MPNIISQKEEKKIPNCSKQAAGKHKPREAPDWLNINRGRLLIGYLRKKIQVMLASSSE
jgi:hypothetical protein